MREKRDRTGDERDGQADVASRDHVCSESLPAVFLRLPALPGSSVWAFLGFCSLRLDSHSIRSKSHVHLELCPTEDLLKGASGQVRFEAFTIYDLGIGVGDFA